MGLVSVTAYAKLHGVSKAAAQKWQGKGVLVFTDGKVDVEQSDRRMMHAGLGRYADAAARQRRGGQETATAPAAQVAGLAEALTAAATDDEALAPVLVAFAERLAQGHPVDLITAQTIKENGLALIRLVEARKRMGEVIELADAEGVIFETFRHQRDAWRNWPSRVGPVIAAELGIAPEKVVEVLAQHVHQQLTDLGEPGDPFSEVRAPTVERPAGVGAAAET